MSQAFFQHGLTSDKLGIGILISLPYAVSSILSYQNNKSMQLSFWIEKKLFKQLSSKKFMFLFFIL